MRLPKTSTSVTSVFPDIQYNILETGAKLFRQQFIFPKRAFTFLAKQNARTLKNAATYNHSLTGCVQECLDQNILKSGDGGLEFPIEQANHRLSINLKAQLPSGLTCQRYETVLPVLRCFHISGSRF
jgi:hypothetical protein